MSLVAAFLWNKSPQCSISTMIVNDENFQVISKPQIKYFSEDYLAFRKHAKSTIREFFKSIKELHKKYKTPITIEFKIVFFAPDVPHLIPAKESEYVYEIFFEYYNKMQQKNKHIKIKPQLRKRLTGRSLKRFKKGLQSLYLVSRKRDTGYEYHLWTVALHATKANYAGKLHRIRTKFVNQMLFITDSFEIGK